MLNKPRSLFKLLFTHLLYVLGFLSLCEIIGEVKGVSLKVPGDVILGGLFPIHHKGSEEVPCGRINVERGIQRFLAMLYAIELINNDTTLLPGMRLGVNILDTCARENYALNQSLEFVRVKMNILDAVAVAPSPKVGSKVKVKLTTTKSFKNGRIAAYAPPVKTTANNAFGGGLVCEDGSQPKLKQAPSPVLGVIGGSYSGVSIQVANLLRLFKIPQVSYASTSSVLSDKARYDYFARTVPPDKYQARAMADIVKLMGWTYVSTVASQGDYGESGIDSFASEAKRKNICVATSEKIPLNARLSDFDAILQNLNEKPNARAIILFLKIEDATDFMKAVARSTLRNEFVWISGDGWGREEIVVKGREAVAHGAITIELQSNHIPGFDDYFKSIHPLNFRSPDQIWHTGASWLEEFWEQHFECRLPRLPDAVEQQAPTSAIKKETKDGDQIAKEPPLCPMNVRIDDTTYKQEGKTQFIIDAVYVMAHALHQFQQDHCRKKRGACKEMKRMDGANFFKHYILNMSFTNILDQRIRLDHHGDGIPKYNILNYRYNADAKRYEYKMVGVWDEALDLIVPEMQWKPSLIESGAGKDFIYTPNPKKLQSIAALLNRDSRTAINDYDSTSREIELEIIDNSAYQRTMEHEYSMYAENHDFHSNLEPRSVDLPKDMGAVNSTDKSNRGKEGTKAKVSKWWQDKMSTMRVKVPGKNSDDKQVPKWDRKTPKKGAKNKGNLNDKSDMETTVSPILAPGSFRDLGPITVRIPVSRCSEPCGRGEIKNMQKGEVCCWICTRCQPWEFVLNETTCADCGTGAWPRPPELTSCYILPLRYMTWHTVYAIIPIAVALLGTFITMYVGMVFLINIDSPLVKASGRELSFMLLGGILICYLCTFPLLAKPTILVCGLQRFLIGFGFAVMYSALLTKTNRISRIFDSASRSAKRPRFISPASQMAIAVVLIGGQIITTIIWFALEVPGTRNYTPENKRDILILKCRIKDTSFLFSLSYNIILIITCTVYAIKTRKIPENFNESKFIGFSMYTTCIIWLAFIPIYFSTLNEFEIQTTTLCIAISLSASVTLFCLFGPKIYIIVFHPEKNVRKLTMGSTGYHKTATSSSATYNHELFSNACTASILGTTSISLYSKNMPSGTNGQKLGPEKGLLTKTSNALGDDYASKSQKDSFVSEEENLLAAAEKDAAHSPVKGALVNNDLASKNLKVPESEAPFQKQSPNLYRKIPAPPYSKKIGIVEENLTCF